MTNSRGWGVVRTILFVAVDVLRLVSVAAGSRTGPPENLFLRKQLTLHAQRQVKPRRANDAARITLVMLSRWIDWRPQRNGGVADEQIGTDRLRRAASRPCRMHHGLLGRHHQNVRSGGTSLEKVALGTIRA
jgi:hypothetical protein